MENVATQVYLTAIVMNLKKLAAPCAEADGLLEAVKRLVKEVQRSWTRWRKEAARMNQWTVHLIPVV